MLQLINLQKNSPSDDVLCLSYTLRHSTPGREGTTLVCPLKLTITPGRTNCQLTVSDCDAPTPDEALDRLEVWLRRLADGVKERKSVVIPL